MSGKKYKNRVFTCAFVWFLWIVETALLQLPLIEKFCQIKMRFPLLKKQNKNKNMTGILWHTRELLLKINRHLVTCWIRVRWGWWLILQQEALYDFMLLLIINFVYFHHIYLIFVNLSSWPDEFKDTSKPQIPI